MDPVIVFFVCRVDTQILTKRSYLVFIRTNLLKIKELIPCGLCLSELYISILCACKLGQCRPGVPGRGSAG